MRIGSGITAGIVKEASFGAGGTIDTYLELIDEGMLPEIEILKSPQMFGSRFMYSYHHGSKHAGGSISMIINPDNIGLLMYATFGTEAAAAQVLATTAYDHEFTPANHATDLGSLHLEIDRGETLVRYPGTVVDNWNCSIARGAYAESSFDLVAQQESDDQSTPASLTPSTKHPYVFRHGSIEIDDGAVAYVMAANWQYQNFIDAEAGHVLDGNAYPAFLKKQNAMISGTLECVWDSNSDALRDALLDNTSKKLEVFLTSHEQIESGYYYTLTLEVPITKIVGDSPVGSTRDRIPFSVNFEGVYDSTNSVKLTLRDARTTQWSA